MPELPEAETVRAQLEPKIVGRTIIQAWARLPRITQPDIETFVRQTQKARVVAANRRGKQLYFPLDNHWNLLFHLGMTGRLHIEADTSDFDANTLHKHIHALLRFDNQTRLVFTDPRTFGAVGVAQELPFLGAMGPEPIDSDFDEAALIAKLQARKTKIKAAILDQTLVAGLGNIYADEVCFFAAVHPETRACDVPIEKLQLLVGRMKPVLQEAILARGATLKDGGYKDTNGEFGTFIPRAYGRTGQECHNCRTPMMRGTLGPGKSARSYHFCPQCQPILNAHKTTD